MSHSEDAEIHQQHDYLPISMPLAVAGAWWTIAELMRRHPGELVLGETIPIESGGYHCLTLTRDKAMHNRYEDPHLQLNLAASTSHLTGFAEHDVAIQLNWAEVVLAPNRRRHVVEPIERALRLHDVAETPATVRGTISFRVMAAFMARAAFAGNSANSDLITLEGLRWWFTQGFFEGCFQNAFYAEFAELPGPPREPCDDMERMPEYWDRHWFLVERKGGIDKPVAAIDVRSGIVWHEGLEFDLMQRYRGAHRSIDRLVTEVFPASS